MAPLPTGTRHVIFFIRAVSLFVLLGKQACDPCKKWIKNTTSTTRNRGRSSWTTSILRLSLKFAKKQKSKKLFLHLVFVLLYKITESVYFVTSEKYISLLHQWSRYIIMIFWIILELDYVNLTNFDVKDKIVSRFWKIVRIKLFLTITIFRCFNLSSAVTKQKSAARNFIFCNLLIWAFNEIFCLFFWFITNLSNKWGKDRRQGATYVFKAKSSLSFQWLEPCIPASRGLKPRPSPFSAIPSITELTKRRKKPSKIRRKNVKIPVRF